MITKIFYFRFIYHKNRKYKINKKYNIKYYIAKLNNFFQRNFVKFTLIFNFLNNAFYLIRISQ